MNRFVIFLLMLITSGVYGYSQPSYNACANPLDLCPNNLYSVTNIGANVISCPSCEDDFNFCFTTDNTVWFSFTTNPLGGDVQVDITNIAFETNPGQDNELQATIIEAGTPCVSSTYTAIGTCVAASGVNFNLTATGLAPSTTYYVVVDGDNNGAGITSAAEATFDISVGGPGVTRPGSTVLIGADSLFSCLNDPVLYFAFLVNCPDSGLFHWYINGTLAAITPESYFEISSLADGDIVSVQTSCYADCPDTVSAISPPITIYSFPVDAGPDVTINYGENVQLNGITTATEHYWSPSYLFSDTSSLSAFVNPTQTVTVTLTATENGCTFSDYLTITVDTELDIPNTFSPNNDNINDTWEIRGIEDYPDNMIIIYDRWGQKVFETTGYSALKSWDGKIRNKVATEGVYFYVLDLRTGDDPIEGTLTIIR